MSSLKVTTPLTGGRYYHLYNRGVNRQQIFFKKYHYQLFLALVTKYLLNSSNILAYSLLPNHFHLVIYIKEEVLIEKDLVRDNDLIGQYTSEQLRRLMIAYSMTINKITNRTGALFGSRFKRIELDDDEYLKYLIFYCHYNPEKHGYCNDFRTYKYSSCQALRNNGETNIDKLRVFDFFDGHENFKNFHRHIHDERSNIILED